MTSTGRSLPKGPVTKVSNLRSRSALYITVQTAADTMAMPDMKNISMPPSLSPKMLSSESKGIIQYTRATTPMKV